MPTANATALKLAHAAALERWGAQVPDITAKSASPWMPTSVSAASKGGPQLTNAYEQSTWFFAGVNLIAAEIYALPLLHQKNGTDIEAPALELFWKNPVAGMSYTDLITATIATLALDGTCYWLLDDSWLLTAKNAPRNPLIFASPEKLQPLKQGAEIIGYKFTDSGSPAMTLLPEQVIRLSNWSPKSTDTGTPNIRPCRTAAHADLLAREYYRAAMQKAATRTAPNVIADGPVLDEGQRAAMEAAIRQSELLDRPTFYSNKVKIDYPTPATPGADFTTNRLGNREEIAIALGIPPSMFQVAASYSVGSASDRYRLIENTCIPRSIKISEAMSRVSALLARDNSVTTRPDWDNHPVIAATRRERLTTAISLFNTGMPWQTINDYLDLGMRPFPGWEYPFCSAAEDEPIPPAAAPAKSSVPRQFIGSETAADLATLANLETLLANPPRRHATACPCCTAALTSVPSPIGRGVPAGRDEGVSRKGVGGEGVATYTLAYRRQMLARRRCQKSTYAAVRRVFMAARAETLKNLAAADLEPDTKALTPVPSPIGRGVPAGRGEGVERKAAAARITFDLSKFSQSFSVTMRARLIETMKAAGRDTWKELRENPIEGIKPPPPDLEDDPLLDADPNAVAALRARENILNNVPGEVYGQVQSAIETALESGESRDKIAARIRAVFNSELAGRATTIAQTETTAIYGAGHLASMKHAGVQYKKWLAGPDLPNSPVRPSHRAAENHPAVPVDEPFLIAGNLMQHPGDPTAPPGETINCRCCIIAVPAP